MIDQINNLVNKIASNVIEIKRRALINLESKLEKDIISDHDLCQNVQLPGILFTWINTLDSQYDNQTLQTIYSITNILKSYSQNLQGSNVIKQYEGIDFLNSFKQDLQIQYNQHQNNKVFYQKVSQNIDKIINNLLNDVELNQQTLTSRSQTFINQSVNLTQTIKQVDCTYDPIQKEEKLMQTLQYQAQVYAEKTENIKEIKQALQELKQFKMIEIKNADIKLELVELSDFDHKKLFELQVRLRYQEPEKLRRILIEEMTQVVKDYPPEIFQQKYEIMNDLLLLFKRDEQQKEQEEDIMCTLTIIITNILSKMQKRIQEVTNKQEDHFVKVNEKHQNYIKYSYPCVYKQSTRIESQASGKTINIMMAHIIQTLIMNLERNVHPIYSFQLWKSCLCLLQVHANLNTSFVQSIVQDTVKYLFSAIQNAKRIQMQNNNGENQRIMLYILMDCVYLLSANNNSNDLLDSIVKQSQDIILSGMYRFIIKRVDDKVIDMMNNDRQQKIKRIEQSIESIKYCEKIDISNPDQLLDKNTYQHLLLALEYINKPILITFIKNTLINAQSIQLKQKKSHPSLTLSKSLLLSIIKIDNPNQVNPLIEGILNDLQDQRQHNGMTKQQITLELLVDSTFMYELVQVTSNKYPCIYALLEEYLRILVSYQVKGVDLSYMKGLMTRFYLDGQQRIIERLARIDTHYTLRLVMLQLYSLDVSIRNTAYQLIQQTGHLRQYLIHKDKEGTHWLDMHDSFTPSPLQQTDYLSSPLQQTDYLSSPLQQTDYLLDYINHKDNTLILSSHMHVQSHITFNHSSSNDLQGLLNLIQIILNPKPDITIINAVYQQLIDMLKIYNHQLDDDSIIESILLLQSHVLLVMNGFDKELEGLKVSTNQKERRERICQVMIIVMIMMKREKGEKGKQSLKRQILDNDCTLFNLLRVITCQHKDIQQTALKCLYILLFSPYSSQYTNHFLQFDTQLNTLQQQNTQKESLKDEESTYLKYKINNKLIKYSPQSPVIPCHNDNLSQLLRVQIYPNLSSQSEHLIDIFNLGFIHNYQLYQSTFTNACHVLSLLANHYLTNREQPQLDTLFSQLSQYFSSHYLPQLIEKQSTSDHSQTSILINGLVTVYNAILIVNHYNTNTHNRFLDKKTLIHKQVVTHLYNNNGGKREESLFEFLLMTINQRQLMEDSIQLVKKSLLMNRERMSFEGCCLEQTLLNMLIHMSRLTEDSQIFCHPLLNILQSMAIDRCVSIRLSAINVINNITTSLNIDVISKYIEQQLISITDNNDHIMVVTGQLHLLTLYLQHSPHKDILLQQMAQYNMMMVVISAIRQSSIVNTTMHIYLAGLLHFVQHYIQLDPSKLSLCLLQSDIIQTLISLLSSKQLPHNYQWQCVLQNSLQLIEGLFKHDPSILLTLLETSPLMPLLLSHLSPQLNPSLLTSLISLLYLLLQYLPDQTVFHINQLYQSTHNDIYATLLSLLQTSNQHHLVIYTFTAHLNYLWTNGRTLFNHSALNILSPLLKQLQSQSSLLTLFQYYLISPPVKIIFLAANLIQFLPFNTLPNIQLSFSLFTLFLDDLDSITQHENQQQMQTITNEIISEKALAKKESRKLIVRFEQQLSKLKLFQVLEVQIQKQQLSEQSIDLFRIIGKHDNIYNKAIIQELIKQNILPKLVQILKENDVQYNQTFFKQVVNVILQLSNIQEIRQYLLKQKCIENLQDQLRQVQLDKPQQKIHQLLLNLLFQLSFFVDTQPHLCDQQLIDYLVDYLLQVFKQQQNNKQVLIILIFFANISSHSKLKLIVIANNKFNALLLYFFDNHKSFSLQLQIITAQILYNLLYKTNQAMSLFNKMDIKISLQKYQQYLECYIDENEENQQKADELLSQMRTIIQILNIKW